MERKSIEVVAAVIVSEGLYFATQRGYGEFKDKWEFPGGKVQAGETREQALRREIREELGADISVDSFICTVEADYPSFHLTMHTFLCHVARGALRLLEAEAARWLRRDQLYEVDWLPADLEVVSHLRDDGRQ